MKENKCKYDIESGRFICTDAENCSLAYGDQYKICISKAGKFCMYKDASDELLKTTFTELKKLKDDKND